MSSSERRGYSVRDVPARVFIRALAEHLKQAELQAPEYVDLIKTGTFKELSPADPDWYYTRAAALARKVYLQPGKGVGYFKKKFGRAIRRGHAPEHHRDAAGGIIRHILLNLEGANILCKKQHEEKKGRFMTPNGQKTLDLVAKQVAEHEQ